MDSCFTGTFMTLRNKYCNYKETSIQRRWCKGQHGCLPSSRSGFDSRPTHVTFSVIFYIDRIYIFFCLVRRKHFRFRVSVVSFLETLPTAIITQDDIFRILNTNKIYIRKLFLILCNCYINRQSKVLKNR